MNVEYVWKINEGGEIEIREASGRLLIQTGIEIGTHLIGDKNFIETVEAAYLVIQIPPGTTLENYVNTEPGYLYVQELARQMINRHGKS